MDYVQVFRTYNTLGAKQDKIKHMKDISIKELIDLATQDVSDPESELKKVYDWHHERKVMIIKGSISVAVSLIVALTIAYLKSEIKITDKWVLLFPLFFSVLSLTYGAYELSKIRRVGKKYIAAITLLNQFKKIKPFLNLYRRTLRGL